MPPKISFELDSEVAGRLSKDRTFATGGKRMRQITHGASKLLTGLKKIRRQEKRTYVLKKAGRNIVRKRNKDR